MYECMYVCMHACIYIYILHDDYANSNLIPGLHPKQNKRQGASANKSNAFCHSTAFSHAEMVEL